MIEVGTRILICQKDERVRRTIRTMLEAGGYQVIEAAAGAECVAAARESKPQLVILERTLPDADGIDICRRIKEDPQLGQLMVVLSSAEKVLPDDRAEALETGADGFIARPIGERQFLAEIAAFLRRQGQRSADTQTVDWWSLTFDAMPEMITLIDNENRIIRANKATRDRLGFETQDVIGRYCYDVLHATGCRPDDCPHAQMQRDGLSHTTTIPQSTLGPDMEVAALPMRDADGNLVGAVHISRDLTDLRNSEQILGNKEDFFQTIIEPLGEGLSETDTDDRFVFANPAAERIFGVSPGGLVGRRLKEFLDETGKQIVTEQSTRRRRGETTAYDLQITGDDDAVRQLLVTATPRVNQAGEQIGAIGVYRDNSRRQQIQKELEDSEARFRALFDNAPISLWEEDFSRVKQYLDRLKADGTSDIGAYFQHRPDEVAHCAGLARIIDVNQATLELLDAPGKESLLGNLESLFTEDSLLVFRDEIVTLFGGNSSFKSEIVGRTLAGELKDCTVWVSIAPGFEDSWSKVFASMVDISESKRQEAQLIESEERFRRTFDEAPMGTAMLGIDGYFTRTNSRFCQILGYTEEELTALTFADITHPEDRAESNRRAEALVSGEVEQIRMDKRYVRKDGDVVWGVVSAQILRDPSGNPLYFLSMLDDVTEHRMAVEALRTSRERYAQAQRAANIGSWDWEILSGELNWSENIDSLFGFKPGEFGGTFQAFLDCVHPDDRTQVKEAVVRAVEEVTEFSGEHRIVWPDGTVRWVLEAGDIARDEQGKPTHLFGIVQDIDDRHQAEITLRQSEQYYRTFFEGAHDPVILFLPQGETVIDVNQRACEVYGFERSEFIGLSLKSISGDVEAGEEQLNSLLTEGFIRPFESVQFHKDGRPLDLEISASLLEHQGEPAILSMNRDITARKSAEAELIKAKETAEAANQAKSDFLTHMSHEVRTPLNAIIGMTDLTLESDLDQQQREFLETAKSSAHHLLAIVNDVLDLAKVEAGKIELEVRVFTLRSLLNELIAAMQPRARNAVLDLECRLQAGVPDTLSGDAGRLRQVLYNLLNNAIKFTDRGSIELVVALVDQIDDIATLRFAVSDTGIGVPEDKLLTIFDPFLQADSSMTRIYGGTGMGLAISRHLVELMGGEIWVESTVGEGSTFRFTVRLKLAQVERAIPVRQEEDVAAPSAGPLQILLAEDFPASQKVAVAILEKRGHEVVVAENGQRAVDEFQRQVFDIVLMDVEMPIMDGIEATKKIREIEGGTETRVPILALTAHAMKGIEERLVAAGMDAVLTKPVRKANLYEAIDRLTGSGGSEPETLK